MKLGLLFSCYETERRLGIRQVCQTPDGEAPLYDVHMASINTNVMDLSSLDVTGCAVAVDPAGRLLQKVLGGGSPNGLCSLLD